MIDAAYCQTMARYNRWMNEKLYDLCEVIPDEQRKEDRGAFFHSIHGTLNHILSSDLAWLSRLTGEPPEPPKLGGEIRASFDALRQYRGEIDERLLAWSATLSADWLKSKLTYTSQMDGITRVLAQWILVVHLFNHQIHHRGQLTTLLTQLGHDPGATDLHKLPGLATVVG